MGYVRTQIYLDPEDHRSLLREARERRISLTALIREIVSDFTHGRRSPQPRSLESLIGFVEGAGTDVAEDEKRYREAVLEKRLRKKLGRGAGPDGDSRSHSAE